MMFRSYYAVRFAPQHEGKNINAVYGCATTIMQALEQFKPEKVLVAFDAPEKTFRHELDPEYKAQRTAAPDEFIAQIDLVKELIEAFNIPLFIHPGFEADDIIGTLATQATDYKSYILSGDLDFLQLVNDRITLARFNGKGPELFDAQATEAKLGIPPNQVIDYKAMCGDSSDNYKGIPGLGPKGAVKLLKDFNNIEGIYANLGQLPAAQKAKFEEHRDYLMHCQHLAKIEQNVPLDFTPQTIPNYEFDSDSLEYFFRTVGFNSLLNRMQNLNHKSDQDIFPEQENESKNDDSNQQLNLF